MQVNGSMDVNQPVAGPVTVTGYVLDNWKTFIALVSGTVSFSAGGGASNPGLPNYINYVPTIAAPVTLSANDAVQISQFIEGWRILRLAWGTTSAQPITIGFWTAHARTGTYSVSVRNSPVTRSYAATYTIAAANVWQYNTVTIPGCTDGVWASDNNAGMIVTFTLASGSAAIASSANTWLAATTAVAPGQVNAAQSTSDACRLSGVVVLPGSEAPSAARSALIMRPYGQELVACKRYYQKIVSPPGSAIGNGASTLFYWQFPFPVAMRAAPTASISANMSFTTGGANYTGTSVSTNISTTDMWSVNLAASGAVPAGVSIIAASTNAAIADARL